MMVTQPVSYVVSFASSRKRPRRNALSDRAYILANCQPEPNSGCWLWLGRVNKLGYGTGRFRDGTAIASRLSFIAFKDLIPTGHRVRHTCDNPSCVNPEHLILGTGDDNMKDKVRRGRQARGERHGMARLTEEEVRVIRASSLTQDTLGRKFGVSQVMISRIQLRKAWRHIS